MQDGFSAHTKPLVMVVEDDAAIATMLRYNLEKHGYRVEEAVDGQEAITRIAETIYYAVAGEPLTAARPKADNSPFAIVRPAGA